ERVQFEEGKDLIFKVTVTKRPEVKLGDYKGHHRIKKTGNILFLLDKTLSLHHRH
ncbi:MAG: trigger factor, partial [Prevotella denticola]